MKIIQLLRRFGSGLSLALLVIVFVVPCRAEKPIDSSAAADWDGKVLYIASKAKAYLIQGAKRARLEDRPFIVGKSVEAYLHFKQPIKTKNAPVWIPVSDVAEIFVFASVGEFQEHASSAWGWTFRAGKDADSSGPTTVIGPNGEKYILRVYFTPDGKGYRKRQYYEPVVAPQTVEPPGHPHKTDPDRSATPPAPVPAKPPPVTKPPQ